MRVGRAIAVALLLSACGSGGASESSPDGALTVLAAASLHRVFPRIGEAFERAHPPMRVRFSFGGTDALATQIEQGAPADVFAGASMQYGDQLEERGAIEPYQTFCTNGLVVVVPASDPAGIGSLEDLARPGVKLVIGAEAVPVGRYTRTALRNLDAIYGHGYSEAVLANVLSNEENVEAVMAKVRLGEADAGFVYVTDARAAAPDVRAVELPEQAQAVASYPIAVVKGSTRLQDARRFIAFVLGAEGQRLVREAGFGPAPS